MARGSSIVVSAEPMGRFEEGIVAAGETHYPGMALQRDATVALNNGKHTYKIYAPGADGENPLGAVWIVTERLNALLGKTATDSYAAGSRVSLYAPQAGDELNLLIENLAGTADDHPLSEKLMINHASGKFIVTTGSPENEHAQLLEAITDPTADTLAWCQWAV